MAASDALNLYIAHRRLEANDSSIVTGFLSGSAIVLPHLEKLTVRGRVKARRSFMDEGV